MNISAVYQDSIVVIVRCGEPVNPDQLYAELCQGGYMLCQSEPLFHVG